MILIKIGGSIIAPKDKIWYINHEYIDNFSKIIQWLDTILVHWTGNIGHWFIKEYWLSKKTHAIWRRILNNYFKIIEDHFPNHTRLKYDKNIDRTTIKNEIIIGGDITTDLSIISSDEIFAKVLANTAIQHAIIATDVDGVLDHNNKIIPIISKDNIDTINFRWKKGDVTGSMKQKIALLIQHNNKSTKTVRICNGYNLENIKNIITTNKGIGTKVLLQ